MTSIALLFLAASQTYNLPPGLLSGLCYVESKHKINAIHLDDGNSHSLGICQIKLSTARQMGYRGSEKTLLNNPRVNIHYSAAYLSYNLRRYDGDFIWAIAAYNAGTPKVTRIGYIRNIGYVKKVLDAWKDRK